MVGRKKYFLWRLSGSAELISDEVRWKKYVKDSLIETSISKDILMLTRVEKPALMRRLFELGCLHSGQIHSYTKILGQLTDAGNTTTLAHYLELLNTAGLLGGIDKYTDSIRQRNSSPKFQVHNTTLISTQSELSFEEIKQKPAMWGRMVESAIGAHLLNSSLQCDFELYYWRHRQHEVDFIIKKGKKLIALEVKTGNKDNTSGMQAFQKEFKSYLLIQSIQPGWLGYTNSKYGQVWYWKRFPV